LARFLEAHYHGRRNGAQRLKQQRESDKTKKTNAQNVLTRASVVGVKALGTDGLAGVANEAPGAEDVNSWLRKHAMPSELVAKVSRDDEEEKRIEAIDAAEQDAVLARLRAFRRRR